MERQVTLVTGPPCGGKSTFVLEHAAGSDLVLCVDRLAQEAGSPVAHNHAGEMYGRAERRYHELCRQVRDDPGVTAWVVRCAPEPHMRSDLARSVGATRSIVLLPNIQVAAARAKARDDNFTATFAAIRSWYQRFRPAPFDEVRLIEADGSWRPLERANVSGVRNGR